MILGCLSCAAACANDDSALTGDWHDALADVVAVERSFAELATDSTVQHAFLTYLDREGILFRPGPVQAHGWLLQSPMPAEVLLEWQPAFADVSIDGGLGYTTGPWRSGDRTQPDAGGGAGQYVTLWRKSQSGYRAVLDFGTANPAPTDWPELALAMLPSAPALEMDAVTARQSVQIANEDLDAALSSSGSMAWLDYAHPSVRWIRNGQQPAVGPEAVPQDAYGLLFVSLGSGSAESGDLAYTWGEWRFATEPDGQAAGQYLRIWRRGPDGQWKVVLDADTRGG